MIRNILTYLYERNFKNMETQIREESKDGKNKSMPFPADSLDESIELLKKLTQARGEQISKSKEISIATGVGEGTLPLLLSTASQYGILENIHGSGYKPTALFTQIISPTFEHDKQAAIFQALSNPPLYKKILEEFNGKIIPNEKGFANYLNTKYSFKSYAIPRIIKSFFTNFKSSIDANNKLRFLAPLKKDAMDAIIQDIEPIIEKSSFVAKIKERESNFQQSIPLPGEKMIILEYPKGNMTKEDFEALTMFINYLALSEGINMKN